MISRAALAVLIAASLSALLALLALSSCADLEPLGADGPQDASSGAPREHPLAAVGTLVGDELPEAPLGPPYPIILVHGFSGWDDLGPLDYFFQVKDALEQDGDDVTTPALPPYDTSQDRAVALARVIDEVLARTHKAKVHLIGHSQGGIDIRVVTATLGYADKIASITTVSTPHDGTAVADLAAAAPAGVLNPAGQLLAWMLGLGGSSPEDTGSDSFTPDLAASIASLTPAAEEALVAHNPIPATIPFFTVAGVSNLRSLDNPECAASLWSNSDRVDDTDPILAATGTYLSTHDAGVIDTVLHPVPNDGLVTVASARAPGSIFLGCVPADHFDEIGQVADLIPDLISGWDHVDFYRKLVANARTTER
ncbi:MAG TPA: alpha/beta fold hydrolase [Myxococcota bacterium]